MGKRSITDTEIALIKAMLGRKMKNSDIQLYFNRPDRKVNSGRITGIGNGSYSNSKAIVAATPSELDAFLANPSSVVPAGSAQPADNPLSQANIVGRFGKGSDGLWRLGGGETDRCECKANFGFKHQDKWLRPIAALANNAGGLLFFGVHDKDTRAFSGRCESRGIHTDALI